MRSDLEVQIRNLFDAIHADQEPLSIEDVNQPLAVVIDAPVVSPRPLVRRGWVVGFAAATVVLLLGSLAFLLRQGTREGSVVTQPGPVPTLVEPEPGPTTPETEAEVELVWTKSDFFFPESVAGVPSTLVSDGDQFFTIIGSELASSVDGFVWNTVNIRNMPTGARLDWVDVDSAASKILFLDVNGSQATTVLIDVAAGEAYESTLPFDPVGAVEDLRGFIALNDDGEAVALLYDLRELSIGETPAFHSTDGINWTRIRGGQLPEGLALQTAALGSGFVVTDAFEQPSSNYWHSPDGRTWETAQADATLPGSLVSWGDSAIAYVESAFGPQAISANPAYLLTTTGSQQLIVDLPPLEGGGGYGPLVAAGEVGIVALTPIGPDPETWFVEYSPDGIVWVRQTLPFSDLNPFAGQPAANADRVLVNVNSEIWVGARP